MNIETKFELPDGSTVESSIVEVEAQSYECDHCKNPITDLYVKVDKAYVCRVTVHAESDGELEQWFQRAIPAFLALHEVLKAKNGLVYDDDEDAHGGAHVH